MRWNYLSLPKLIWEGISNFISHWACDYLSMLWLKLKHVSKRCPRCPMNHQGYCTIKQPARLQVAASFELPSKSIMTKECLSSRNKWMDNRQNYPYVLSHLALLTELYNRPMSQIPQCTSYISHIALFRTEIYTFLFWMVHCGIWNMRIVGFVN